MDYIALTTYLLVMIITPGPNNLMLTASGANFGYRRTVPHIMGILAGGTVQTVAGCLGLGAVFTQFPLLHQVLTWVGLVYMLYLAWKMLGLGNGKARHVPEPLTFTQAALFQFVNTKAWVIIATLATIFMPKTGEVIWPTFVILLEVFVITAFATHIWTLFGKAMGKFLKTKRNQMVFNIILAALLAITAIMIVVK